MDAALPDENEVAAVVGRDAGERQAIGTRVVGECPPLVGAGQYAAAMPDDHDTPVRQPCAIGQAGLQGVAAAVLQADLLPAVTESVERNKWPRKP